MDAELNRLEAQLEQLLSMYAALRNENRELRTQQSRLEADNRLLVSKVNLAAEKLDAVLSQLPQ
jgi:cell division protein ZapB